MKTPGPVRPQRVSPPHRASAQELLSARSFVAATVVLIVAIFLIYLPTLNFQFILDDHRFLSDPRVQSPGHVWEYFSNYVWAQFSGGPATFYRPLFILWLRINFILAGVSSAGWHFLSIVKHVSVAGLLGITVWALLRDPVAALLAAGLFALHPAQTESVAWVTVPDPLMSVAVLAAVLLFLRYLSWIAINQPSQSLSNRKRRKAIRNVVVKPSVWWLLASAGACLAALLAKETAIILPVFFLALGLIVGPSRADRTSAPHGERGRSSRLLYALQAWAPYLGVTVIYLVFRFSALGGKLGANTQDLGYKTILLSFPATAWFYIKVMFWPVQLRAFADPTQINTLSVHAVLLPGLAVGCTALILTALLLWAWRKSTRDLPALELGRIRLALCLGVLLLVLPILPALNLNALNPGDFLHGRYTYLPLAGLMLLFATAWHLADQWRLYVLSAAILVAFAFAVLTWRLETAWKDDLTVFTVAHQIAPHNQPVALNLARARVQETLKLAEWGQCDDAIPVFQQVTREFPNDWFAWAALGDCQAQLNDFQAAEQSLHRAADLSRKPQVIQEWEQVRTRVPSGATLPSD